MQVLSCKHPIIRSTTALLLCCLLFIFGRTPPGDTPAELEQPLQKLRDKNDLAGWIYLQVQWVAKSPANRSAWLQQAVNNSWRSPSTNEEIQAWQDLLINEGYSFLISGDIVRSTDAYTSAFQWARQHAELADDNVVLENILKPLGNNYTRLGDYEQALFIHRKALAVAQALGDPASLAGTFTNLANTASNMGHPAESLDYCRQGLTIAKGSTPLRGLLLAEQADALLQLGQPQAARQSIAESIETLEKTSTPEVRYWLLTAYQQAGDIYTDDPAKALAFYQKALTLEEQLSKEHNTLPQRQKAKLFQRIGALYAHTGKTTPALHWLNNCLSVLLPGRQLDSLQPADLYGENTLIDLLFTAAGLEEGQGQTDKALRLYKLCFAAEYELRRELISGSSKERSVSDSHIRYETAIRAAWDAWKRSGNPAYRKAILEFMEDSKARLLLDEVLQQQQLAGTPDSVGSRIDLLEKALIYYKKEALQQPDSIRQTMTTREKQVEWDLSQLRKKIDATGARTIRETPDDTDTKDLLKDDHKLLRSFFAGATNMYVVESGRTGIIFADRLDMPEGWQDSLRAFTRSWFEKGAGNMINHPSAYYDQAYNIYRQLFSAHPLATGKEIILLPDGALSLLPIDALVTTPVCPPSPADWNFVIRQTDLSYAWSIRTLQQQMHSPGNSDGITGFFLTDTRQLPLLNNIAAEEKAMAGLIKDGKWYKDDKATTDAFRQALRESAIVHISSHAFSGKDTGQIPHIELYDQPFYLFELKDISRHPALVVLSACRTGDGRMVTGEGVQSLARAFTAEGANAVVAGWWNVNDVTAARLIEDFYRGWIDTNKGDIAGALRQSKLDWLTDPQTAYQYKLPYYWAALNYSGNPDPLQRHVIGKNKMGLPVWAIAAMAALAVLVLLVVFLRVRR